jgi:outer membrane protein assembly factor BamB
VGRYEAVADFEGYVHLLSQVDGSLAGRVKVDGDGVRADMLSDGNILYVFGNSGDMVAYEITQDD